MIVGWTEPKGGRQGLGALLLGYYDGDGRLVGVVTLTDPARGETISAARAGSGGDAGHGFPLRHGVEAMKLGGKGGAMGTGRDEEIADG
ncbi:hypothetical protein SAMN05444161_9069 [Rhizobiales bacterium GAS191]|nr:hypothetical protein SAMN05444161_9069 [Rhizobiales bacterium GAS191]